jgi:hypothetical protein
MRYFTDSPYERMMVQRPRQQGDQQLSALPSGYLCIGCERHKNGCSGPCYCELNLKPKRKEEENAIGDR